MISKSHRFYIGEWGWVRQSVSRSSNLAYSAWTSIAQRQKNQLRKLVKV